MSDPYTQALKEAYASNEENTVVVSTLEIYTSDVSINEIRLVLGYEDFIGKLESTAPRDASASVTFTKSQFGLSLPEVTDRLPQMELTVDNVSNILGSVVENIIDSRLVVSVIYREFLSSDTTPEPHYVLKNLELKNITIGSSVIGQLYFADYSNRAFPNAFYKVEDHPTLGIE